MCSYDSVSTLEMGSLGSKSSKSGLAAYSSRNCPDWYISSSHSFKSSICGLPHEFQELFSFCWHTFLSLMPLAYFLQVDTYWCFVMQFRSCFCKKIFTFHFELKHLPFTKISQTFLSASVVLQRLHQLSCSLTAVLYRWASTSGSSKEMLCFHKIKMLLSLFAAFQRQFSHVWYIKCLQTNFLFCFKLVHVTFQPQFIGRVFQPTVTKRAFPKHILEKKCLKLKTPIDWCINLQLTKSYISQGY